MLSRKYNGVKLAGWVAVFFKTFEVKFVLRPLLKNTQMPKQTSTLALYLVLLRRQIKTE